MGGVDAGVPLSCVVVELMRPDPNNVAVATSGSATVWVAANRTTAIRAAVVRAGAAWAAAVSAVSEQNREVSPQTVKLTRRHYRGSSCC